MKDTHQHGITLPRLGKTISCESLQNLPPGRLIEESIRNGEGILANTGVLIVETGEHTGRSPNDKFIVDYGQSADQEIAWGEVNKAISPENAEKILNKAINYLSGTRVYVQDVKAGNHPLHTKTFRIITEQAWAALFTQDLLIPTVFGPDFEPDFTILHVPNFKADPNSDETNSSTVIFLDFVKKLVFIGGSSYAGEIKKSVFTVMNRILPGGGVLPMHCSANIGVADDTALFFGLSGTGKTTLSSSHDRRLIGDDEHGWGEDGVFNFEGGCYAKTIKLKQELEPLIWEASQRFGSVLENVVYDQASRVIDFDSDQKTENTRAAYPLRFIEGHVENGRGKHPRNIFFLTADAFGVLPPISWLTDEQASYYFLLGYTAKLAGTEKGLGKEPQATFSSCFGEPFLPLPPEDYGNLLLEKIKEHKPRVWLINTGWTGGPYGVGHRIELPYSRAMINWALNIKDGNPGFHKDDNFGLMIPDYIEGIPDNLLDPVKTWSNAGDYRSTAAGLIQKMKARMERFAVHLDPVIMDSGPK